MDPVHIPLFSFSKNHLIISFHLFLGLPSGIFPYSFSQPHSVLLHLFTLIIFGGVHEVPLYEIFSSLPIIPLS
jgi:hypothetical protein